MIYYYNVETLSIININIYNKCIIYMYANNICIHTQTYTIVRVCLVYFFSEIHQNLIHFLSSLRRIGSGRLSFQLYNGS